MGRARFRVSSCELGIQSQDERLSIGSLKWFRAEVDRVTIEDLIRKVVAITPEPKGF